MNARVAAGFFYLFFSVLSTAEAQLVMGARETALGQAVTALPATGWSVFNNPAFLTSEPRQISFYSIRYFGVKELTDVAFQATIPFGKWRSGIGIHHFGGEIYSESRFRAGISRQFGQFSAGAVGNFSVLRYGGPYQNQHTFSVDAGLAWSPLSAWTFGARAVNLVGGQHNDFDVEPARELAGGVSFKATNEALFTADLVKDVRYAAAVRIGSEFLLAEIIALRVGVTTEPETFSAGVGIKMSKFRANFVLQRHQVGALGVSPGIDVQWQF